MTKYKTKRVDVCKHGNGNHRAQLNVKYNRARMGITVQGAFYWFQLHMARPPPKSLSWYPLPPPRTVHASESTTMHDTENTTIKTAFIPRNNRATVPNSARQFQRKSGVCLISQFNPDTPECMIIRTRLPVISVEHAHWF